MICEHLFHYKYLTNRLQFSVPVCRYTIIRLQMKSERVKSYKSTTRDEVEWEKYCCLRAVYRTLQYTRMEKCNRLVLYNKNSNCLINNSEWHGKRKTIC